MRDYPSVLAACEIEPDVENWHGRKFQANSSEFVSKIGEVGVPTQYTDPRESRHFNRSREDWDWNKNLSVWRPEHIHVLADTMLCADTTVASGEHSSIFYDSTRPTYSWSSQEVDPVVWKTHPFMTACKAMRFFSQYALDAEALSKVFPPKQIWFFDSGCMGALEDILGFSEDPEDTVPKPWVFVIKVFRDLLEGLFVIRAEGIVANREHVHLVMDHFSHGTVLSSDLKESAFGRAFSQQFGLVENSVPRAHREENILLASLIDFIQQKVTLKIKKGIHSKKVKKRLEKKLGYVPEYTVMSLRTVEADEGTSGDGDGRKLLYRQLVREHYKTVAVGPGRRRRRLVLIDTYERGPEDAPLIVPKKSKKVIR